MPLSHPRLIPTPSPDLRLGLLRCRLFEAKEVRLRRDVYITALDFRGREVSSSGRAYPVPRGVMCRPVPGALPLSVVWSALRALTSPGNTCVWEN